MPDSLDQLLAGRTYRGTGDPADYFALGLEEKPDFIPPGANYDPSLNEGALVASGVDPQFAKTIQMMRAKHHAAAYQGRMASEEQQGQQALQGLDVQSPLFSQQLAKIFQKNPSLATNPRFGALEHALRGLEPKQPDLTPEDITDPEFSQKYAQRRSGGMNAREAKQHYLQDQSDRQTALDLIGLGSPPSEHEHLLTPEGHFDPYAVAQRKRELGTQAMAKLGEHENTMLTNAFTKFKQVKNDYSNLNPTDEQKKEWAMQHLGHPPKSVPEWQQAYSGVRNDVIQPAHDAVLEMVMSALEQNKNVPEHILKELNLPVRKIQYDKKTSKPQVQLGGVKPLPSVQSTESEAALPAGFKVTKIQ